MKYKFVIKIEKIILLLRNSIELAMNVRGQSQLINVIEL